MKNDKEKLKIFLLANWKYILFPEIFAIGAIFNLNLATIIFFLFLLWHFFHLFPKNLLVITTAFFLSLSAFSLLLHRPLYAEQLAYFAFVLLIIIVVTSLFEIESQKNR